MILDDLLEFADNDTLTVGTGTNNEGDTVDLGTGDGIDLGGGEPIYLVVTIGTAVTSAGAATVAFQLVSDATDPAQTDGTQSIHFTSAPIGKAALTAGAVAVVAPLPAGGAVPYERYLGIQAVVGTAALTAGTFNAFLTKDPHRWEALADAVN